MAGSCKRGAQRTLWQPAALGLLDRVEHAFTTRPLPTPDDITNAFWCACHGGQRATAAYLLARGAERDWIGNDTLTPLDAARRSDARELVSWLQAIGARSAAQLEPAPRAEDNPGCQLIRRAIIILAALYAAAAVIGHARERTGAISCGCSEDCWCKRPGLSALRWVFPFRHTPRTPS